MITRILDSELPGSIPVALLPFRVAYQEPIRDLPATCAPKGRMADAIRLRSGKSSVDNGAAPHWPNFSISCAKQSGQ